MSVPPTVPRLRCGAFNTLVQLYRTRLDTALSTLTAYRTAVEGQVALGQLNMQKVEIYKARIGAVQSSVEMFAALMRGAATKAEVIRTQFDAYRADVAAYATQLSAEKVKFDAYDTRVRAEGTKAEILDAQARAYAATVQGVVSKADVQVKAVSVRMEAARAKVQEFMAQTDAFKAQIDAALGHSRLDATVFGAQIDAWRAKAGATTAASEVQARFADVATRTNIAYAEMQIEEYKAQVQKAVEQANIALEAAKAMGSFTAQLAAGAMSAMHVQASISGEGAATTSQNTNTGYSYSD